MVRKGTTLYKLNKAVEERGKKLVERGYHNTMSDLVEHAAQGAGLAVAREVCLDDREIDALAPELQPSFQDRNALSAHKGDEPASHFPGGGKITRDALHLPNPPAQCEGLFQQPITDKGRFEDDSLHILSRICKLIDDSEEDREHVPHLEIPAPR